MPDPTPLFVAVGHHGQRLASRDGSNWQHVQVGKEGETYRAIAFGNGRFAAVGSYGGENMVAATTDGQDWKVGKKNARYCDGSIDMAEETRRGQKFQEWRNGRN